MNIFNSEESFLKRLRSKATIDPVRDWLVLLVLSAVVLMGIIIWNVWTFDTVAKGGTIGAPTTKAPTTFNNSSLDTIHSIFENRAAEEVKYVTDTYDFTDPSQ